MNPQDQWANFMNLLGIGPQKQMPAQQLWPEQPMKMAQTSIQPPNMLDGLRGRTPLAYMGIRG